MSGLRNPRSSFVLGKGRSWDGFPLPAEILDADWWSRAAWWYSDGSVPRRVLDVHYDCDEQELYVVTDVGFIPVCKDRAERLVRWFRSHGAKVRDLRKIMRSKKQQIEVPRTQARRDQSGNTIQELRRVCSPGQERRLRREMDGEGRRRSRDRTAARRFKKFNAS